MADKWNGSIAYAAEVEVEQDGDVYVFAASS